jgi:hypothetical protein
MTKTVTGESVDTDLGAKDFLKESFLFQAPDQFLADASLAKRLLKMKGDSGRTRSQIDSLGRDRRAFGGLAERSELDVANVNPERRRLRAATGLSSALALRDNSGSTQGSTLQAALRQAKARQGIVNRGDAAIGNQRLKDRLGFVRSSLRRRTSALDLQGAGQQIRAGVTINAQNARDSIQNARLGAAGTAVGAAFGVASGNKTDNGSFFDFGQKNKTTSTGKSFF